MTELTRIKIMARPKAGAAASAARSITASGTGKVGTGSAAWAARADEAAHADKATAADTAASADQARYAQQAGRANYAARLEEDSPVMGLFLRKDTDDSSDRDYSFSGDISVSGLLKMLNTLKLGASHSITPEGDATLNDISLNSATLRRLRSADYDYNSQTGFSMAPRQGGGYKLSLSELEVWGRAVFHELEVRKLSYVGGNFIFSPAGSTIIRVDEMRLADGGLLMKTVYAYKCWFLADDGQTATQNLWRMGDLALSETFSLEAASSGGSASRRYWRKVIGVSTENETILSADGAPLYDGRKFGWIMLSNNIGEFENNSAKPAAGDTLCCLGNTSDTKRQNAVVISTVGDTAPALIQYEGVSGFSLTSADKTVISPKGNKFTGDFYTSSGSSVEDSISKLEQNAKSITTRVAETEGSLNTVTGRVDAVANQVGELQVESGRVSMKVSQQDVRDRNLIPCSMVRLGTDKYGAMLRTVRLVKGKRYALSVWGRIDSTLKARGGKLVAYVYRENAGGAWTWSQSVEIQATELTRQVVKFVYGGDTADCHTMVYASPKKAGGGNIYVEKMQLEEIPEAQYAGGEDVTDGTAWSLSAQDAAVEGSLVPPVGEGWTLSSKTEIERDAFLADGYHVAVCHAKATDGAEVDVLAYDSNALHTLQLEEGETYTLSFWARGTGSVHSYLYPGGCSHAVRDDGEASDFEDGHIGTAMALSAGWKRRWITFSVKTTAGLNLLPVRLLPGGEVWVAGVKLEKGGRMTDYGAYAEELLATGIDIENRRITVTADQFRIRNNRGEDTFEVDADGMVTMNNIAVGGVINRQGIEVTGDAVAAQLFDIESDSFGNEWYVVPKLDLLYPIYYIKGSDDTYTRPFELHMPSAYVDEDGAAWGDVWGADGKVDKNRLRKVRAMVGNVVTIYNDASDANAVVKVKAMSDYFTDIWKGTKSQSAQSQGVAVQAVSSSADTTTAAGYGTLDNAWESGGLIYPYYPDDSKPMRSYLGKQRDELVYEVKRGAFISLRCVCEVNNLGRECVYWVANYGMGFDTE